MKITFIQTGGTIDKDLPKAVNGYAFEIGEPAVIRILAKVKSNFEYEIIPLLQKDSLDLDDADREKIRAACEACPNDRIIITHGTDTMTKTAAALSEIKDKTIVFTGAIKPERFLESDAMFNLGGAVLAVQLLPPGIYITMNGRYHLWNKVRKHQITGQFVEV